jgi:myosin heavy subunit
MAHIYENGTRAWQPDPTDGWVASEVVDKQIEGDKVKLVFQLENGEVRTRRRGGVTATREEPRLTMHCTEKNR